MVDTRRQATVRWWSLRRLRPWLFLAIALTCVRWSKGAGFLDSYALIIRPFWPGSAQKDWIQNGFQLEREIQLSLLESDNRRLREMLELKRSKKNQRISAAVISRNTNGWWQQLELNKGLISGINSGDAVIGPGGLIGIIHSVTPLTSRVRLLTAPGSRVGVWIDRTKRHGVLLGIGTNRPQMRFLNKDPQANPGDIISTSPASTLFPPNLPVGVIQHIDKNALPAPIAMVQLTAAPEAIDWVQVVKP